MSTRQRRGFLAFSPAIMLTTYAALTYNSWPLGFVLNPYVARNHLASMLQTPSQPYWWVFVFGDVFTMVLVVLAALLVYRKAGGKHTVARIAMAYLMFGITAGAAALIPESCDPVGGGCGNVLSQPLTLIHGGISIAAAGFLFLSLLLTYKAAAQYHLKTYQALLVLLIGGWLLTGAGRFIFPASGNDYLWWQYFFISLCGITMIVCVAAIERMMSQHPPRDYRTLSKKRMTTPSATR